MHEIELARYGSDAPTGLPPFLFIVGRGRSGTTLMRAMFDSHPQMAVADESHFIVMMANHRRRYEGPRGVDIDRFLGDLRGHFARWGLSEEAIRESLALAQPAVLADAVRSLYALYARAHGKVRYGDKTPSYVINIPLLADLLPESRFLHMIRDGRNASLSYMDLEFGPRSLAEAAIYWKRFVARGRETGRRLGPARYHEVRYEDLLSEPERVMREACSFAELAFDEAMLRYFERADRVVGRRAHYRNVYLPPTKGLRDWRTEMSPESLAVVEALTGDLLGDLGYERALPVVPPKARVSAFWAQLHVTRERAARRIRKWARRLGRRMASDGAER